MTLLAVDYFCGAGGASQGLHEAGYKVIGYDAWPVAVATHNANRLPAHVHDLSDPTGDEYLPHGDLAWFSTPCQPFSAAGDGEGEFDERDGFPWALRILRLTRPAVAIFENVKGLTFAKHEHYFHSILAAIRSFGYDLQWQVLNAADYGVPQTRERCFIVARCDGGRITWPTVTHTEQAGMFTEKWIPLVVAVPRFASLVDWEGPARTVCGDRGPRWAYGANATTGRTLTLHYRQNDRDGEPITSDVTDRPCPTVGTKSQSQWWIERPATTINGDVRVSAPGRHDPNVSGSQQADAIRLTIPELARLQDFPDGWQWCGTKTDQARQIGNACPRTFARLLAEANRPTVERVA